MRPFREYKVWQIAHELTLSVYEATKSFPADERFALTSQIRRAAYSVPFNIVEGSARGEKEFHQFLRIALASAAELDYGLLLAHDLGYLNHDQLSELTARIGVLKPMMVRFMQKLESPQQTAIKAANRQQRTANGPTAPEATL